LIRKASEQDIATLTQLALRLWPDNTFETLREELLEILSDREAAFFLAERGEKAVGFAQCQLRHDYVEGTESSPVGYLEGIFVEETLRRQGTARQLLKACEKWALEQGCVEFASDCELDNTESLHFHLSVGFEEAGRIICFRRKLGED